MSEDGLMRMSKKSETESEPSRDAFAHGGESGAREYEWVKERFGTDEENFNEALKRLPEAKKDLGIDPTDATWLDTEERKVYVERAIRGGMGHDPEGKGILDRTDDKPPRKVKDGDW